MFAGALKIYGKGMTNPIRTIDLRDLFDDLDEAEIGRVRFEGGVNVDAITTNGAVDLHSDGTGSAAGGRSGEGSSWFEGSIGPVEA